MAPNLVIVGAGLVGSLWAVLLRKAGIPVTVFEKRPDPRKANKDVGRSINLVVTSRGLYGLECAGLLEEALKLTVRVKGREIHSRDAHTVFQPYGQANECNYSISRSALNHFLLDAAEAAGADLHFDHALDSMDLSRKEITFSREEGPRTVPYEFLFGTDGAGSRVRNALTRFPKSEIKDSIEWLDADYKELFLPRGPQGPLLSPEALHIWPRGSLMLMALANLDGSFTLTLYMPKKGSGFSFETVKTQSEVEKLFQTEFPDALQLAPELIQQYLGNPQSSLGTVRCSSWTSHHSVALMGDAAHAIVPFFGQGMNSGFEDCTVLLEKYQESKDWAKAIEEYNETQRPNANAIADMALENWVEMRDRVGDPAFQLRKKVEWLLEKNFPEHFRSRYAMITYTRTPYAKAQAIGRKQDKLLDTLCSDLHSPEDLSLEKAKSLLENRKPPT
jgi:kynurenine 3-monooxygenase